MRQAIILPPVGAVLKTCMGLPGASGRGLLGPSEEVFRGPLKEVLRGPPERAFIRPS